MAKLAADLGVSTMAVSLALRGRPGVSEELRERVVCHARLQGYVPDPVAAELMSVMRMRRSHTAGQQLIAFVNTFAEPQLLARVDTFKAFLEGSTARGENFGYRVEAFNACDPGMTGARLSQLLRERGVRGILVGPRWREEPEVEMDWQDFSVVLVGEVAYGPTIYRVSNHHTCTCLITLRRLAELGYRRIGLALMEQYERQRDFDFALGVDQFRRGSPYSECRIEVWLYRNWDEAKCEEWMRLHQLDAVVSLEQEVGHFVLRINASRSGEPVGYANLDVQGCSTWSGVDQHSHEVGGAAMDLLRNLLLGERGVSSRPKTVLVDGEWRDGTTTRDQRRRE